MGIAGLYKFLDPCVTKSHLKYYSGKTIAVDMPCWVHRGAIADAQKIVMGGDDSTGSKVIGFLITVPLQGFTRFLVFK